MPANRGRGRCSLPLPTLRPVMAPIFDPHCGRVAHMAAVQPGGEITLPVPAEMVKNILVGVSFQD